jgi:hypothetical protein
MLPAIDVGIAPHTKVVDEVERWLTLHGLRPIWQKNQ